MASEHAYSDITTVENFTGIDYSTIDSVRLADAKVEAKITAAEWIINGYFGTSDAVTITDGVKLCTTIIAAKLLDSNLKSLGYQTEGHTPMDLIQLTIPEILQMFLHETEDSFVESIPMSGASYHKPDTRMSL